ncbi:hypothetical protein FB45DRAFT_1001125 [Roridomyces roridus]|uniref:Uncharacterized protein n=1 Tax=Roridomyces roridus TaxID=1738132 RepID=A0AAD7C574_9AGAR|nr:hypothetical protein FB45DRAFT_1001125 [Roridomyces roridus]
MTRAGLRGALQAPSRLRRVPSIRGRGALQRGSLASLSTMEIMVENKIHLADLAADQSDAPGCQNCIWQHNDTHGARIDSGTTNTLLVEYQNLLNFALYTDYTGTAPTARLWRLPTKAAPAEKIARGDAGEGGRKAARGLETIPTRGREMIRRAT